MDFFAEPFNNFLFVFIQYLVPIIQHIKICFSKMGIKKYILSLDPEHGHRNRAIKGDKRNMEACIVTKE
jgi:hypothetical protein